MYKILTNRLGENLEKSFKKTKDAPCAPERRLAKYWRLYIMAKPKPERQNFQFDIQNFVSVTLHLKCELAFSTPITSPRAPLLLQSKH